jgi:tRNA A37 threonylcarbamoyltransferase TsaD
VKEHQLPLIAVNHMEGHALMVRLVEDVKFPFLALLISGGKILSFLFHLFDVMLLFLFCIL